MEGAGQVRWRRKKKPEPVVSGGEGGDALYVHTRAALEPLLASLRDAEAVGLDTEFIGEGNYEPQLCLVQVATSEGIWIVDPLALKELGEFWELVTAPEREMVVLAAREEIRFCVRYAGRAPARLLDLQIAAGLTGYGFPLSHTNLVREVLGIRVKGGEALTDWRQRPLSGKQLEYAADDVRHLLAVRERLLQRATEMGTPTGTDRRAWIEDECRRLVEGVVQEGQEERWRRGSGSGSLSRRELAVLREVWRWREETARRTNQPPRRIMRDDMLVEIAKRQPGSAAELLTLRGLDRAQGRGVAAAIVEAVQRGMQLPNSELPESLRRHDPPQIGVLTQLLAAVMQGISAEAEVDATLLAPMEELREVVRWRLDRTGTKEEPFAFQGWRGEILRAPLTDLLDGKRTIRVARIKSPNPLSVE